MRKSILNAAGIVAAAALFCVTCNDNGLVRSPNNDGDANRLVEKFHGVTGNEEPPPPVITYTLAVGRNNAGGGSVSRAPSKTAYDAGESVMVTASPNEGYAFTGWTGSVESAVSPLLITMDGNKSLTANFSWQSEEPPPERVAYELIIGINPAEGGYVSRDPDYTDYEAGTQVTITAAPRDNYKFKTWEGDATTADAEITITMNGNKALIAVFEQTQTSTTNYTVSFSVNGGSGTTPATQTVNAGKSVTLPGGGGLTMAGYNFGGWNTSSGGNGTNYSAGSSYTPTDNITLYAKWNSAKIDPNNPTDPNNIIIEMIHVEGGTFIMGCTSEQGSDCNNDESPTNMVTVSSFSIGKYEVTQGQWKAVMGSLPSKIESKYGIGNGYPVYAANWWNDNDLQTFIDSLNRKTGKTYRLPTEAEWEYAARGGNSSNGYKYSGSNTLGNVAWYSGNSGEKTHQVGTKAPNELGIYDMSGNVREMVSDWYSSSYYSSMPIDNPTGPATGSDRVYRGGSFYSEVYGGAGSAQSCRVSNRCDWLMGRCSSRIFFDVGLRLVLSQ